MIIYRTSTPRAALAVAAAAMAAVTMAVMVVLPAELEAGDAPQYVQANASRTPVVSALPGSSVVGASFDSEDDAPPGHAELDAPEPCVHAVASVISRNRT